MAYGGPNSLADVEPYLNDIRGGRPSSPELVAEIVDRYRQIGGKSPLLEISTQQARALEQRLNADGLRVRVYVGMRHWQPRIKEAVSQAAADGVTRLTAVCLAPHYSRMSVGAYFEKVKEAVAGLATPLEVRYVKSWHDEPLLLKALAEHAREGLAKFPASERASVEIIFTAHSLPTRILKDADPYPDELLATARGVAALLDGKNPWRFAYQSQGRTPEPWLGPTVEATLDELAKVGTRHVLIAPVGFVADHVEILYDVDIVFKHQAEALGMQLERIDMLNVAPPMIAGLADLVRNKAKEADWL